MAKAKIEVEVAANFAKVTNQLQGIHKSFNSFTRSIKNSFIGLGSVIASGLAVRKFIEIADKMTLMEGRLKLVTASSADLAIVQEKLLKVSNQTRVSYEATGELYARLGRTTRTLGVSQEAIRPMAPVRGPGRPRRAALHGAVVRAEGRCQGGGGERLRGRRPEDRVHGSTPSCERRRCL